MAGEQVTAPGFTLGAIKPQDSIASFTARKLLRPGFRWESVWQAEHARAFTVAGVMRLDVLALIRAQVDKAVEGGLDLATFSKALKPQLQAKGFWGDVEVTDPDTGEVRTTRFNAARLRLIFEVNMRQSAAAGRWARGMRGRLPFVVYRTMGDERVRASHRPWDFLVLPREHPFWDTHIPPNGWGCRCSFYFTDQAGVDALKAAGFKIRTEPPPIQWVEFLNRVTGQTERVPRGIDPGFAYNPGKLQGGHIDQAAQRLQRTLNRVGPTAPGAGNAQQLTSAVVARMRSERGFRQFLKDPPPAQLGMPVAAIPAQAGEPAIASVSALDLRAQIGKPDYPRPLPTTAAAWALGQAIVDNGERLELADGSVLWWWLRGAAGVGGDTRRVLVFELRRTALVWWVRTLTTLTPAEALALYPALSRVLG